ncbi:hypothetical protein ABT263_14770 [Kitasatospora sp. NPDC001603]|uniref:hypothetical protein n=1 Tax=Kitasatospora sp. NPDC001603 TaxID=3154388 RepID=UPI0033284E85
MRITLTRASVAMGDDVDAPHEAHLESDGATTLGEFVRQVALSGYFPQMACWVVFDGRRKPAPAPIAMLSAPWEQPRFLDDALRHRSLDSLAGKDGELGELGENGELSLFFDYRATIAPDVLWQRLSG